MSIILWPIARHLTFVCAFVGLVLIESADGQGNLTIGFEGPPTIPSGSGAYVGEYSESGMWFRPIGIVEPGNGFIRQGGGFASYPENGTTYLQTSFGDSLTFSFTDGSLFNLLSVDLAEYSTVVPEAVTVQFIGYYANGSTILQSFTTDGIIDGTGPLADFQTFYFSAAWTGLSRVEVPGYGWSMDNVVVGIPEPSTPALLLLGLPWLARLLRQRRRG
jgi:hypothetical protein